MSNSISTTTQSKKNSASYRFQKLWDEAESTRNANLELEKSLEALVVQLQAEVNPHERKLGMALRQQLFKLITFSSRKSLLQWQRSELEDWIAESMNTLQYLGLVDAELIEHLARAEAQLHNVDIDEHSDVPVVDQLAAAYNEQLLETTEFDISETDDDFDDDEDFDFSAWYNEQMSAAGLDHDDDAHQQGSTNQHTAHVDNADANDEHSLQNSKTLFKKLFHRAARALHPDKAADPVEQQARQVLMSKLLEARRNQDLMSLVELYRKHVDSDIEFAEKEFMELEEVLHRFIQLQHQKRIELIRQSPTHEMSYDLLYGKSPAAIKRKINQIIKDIDSKMADIETFTTSVTSLNKLKPHLQARHDEWYEAALFSARGPW